MIESWLTKMRVLGHFYKHSEDGGIGIEEYAWVKDGGKEPRSNVKSKSTYIRASERRAGKAQLRSLEPTSQWAAGGQERRSGYP